MARNHVFVMPGPYISAINGPHVKVMGITGEKVAGTTRRARGCHTLILGFSLEKPPQIRGAPAGRAN
jgi:hypothetical protein